MEFDTGNPDLTIRWDNTVRFNLGVRVESRDDKIGNSAISDEGTYSFDKGDLVATRFDVLSELDVVFRKRHGLRLSAAGWYDAAYDDTSHSNPNLPFRNIPSYVNHQYSDYTKRFYRGPSGEILDAFVFSGFDVGPVPAAVKAGRHSLYWGESLFLNGNLNGIAYAQNPLDLQKGFATPGVEAKELFRPLTQLSGQAQVTDESVDRSAVFARMGIVPLSRGRHVSRSGRLRVQRPAPPVPASRLGSVSRNAETRSSPIKAASGVLRRAGAPNGSTVRWAFTTATSPTSCRRLF